MSHFAVLVIGENPEKQLAPYHEFECTGLNDQYVQSVDETEEFKAQMAEVISEKNMTEKQALEDTMDYYGIDDSRIVEDETQVDFNGEHMYGYVVMGPNGLEKYVNRTNPNKKWD